MDKKCPSLFKRIVDFASTKKISQNQISAKMGTLPWKVEVALVALGRKPLALTHFDTLDASDWDDDMYLDASLCHVQSIIIPQYSLDYKYPLLYCDRYGDGSSLESKPLPETELCAPINSIGSIIWFLEENRPSAILLAKEEMSRLKGGNYFPEQLKHEINGILFGYSDASILKFTGKSDISKVEQAHEWIVRQLQMMQRK